MHQALDIANLDNEVDVDEVTLEALKKLYECSKKSGVPISFDVAEIVEPALHSFERVIMPGSVGLTLHNANQEFIVENVFFHPKFSGLCYRGRYTSQKKNYNTVIIFPITSLAEILGESQIGYYNYDTGELHKKLEQDI